MLQYRQQSLTMQAQLATFTRPLLSLLIYQRIEAALQLWAANYNLATRARESPPSNRYVKELTMDDALNIHL